MSYRLAGPGPSTMSTRHAFLTLVPYLRAFHAATAHRLPESLARDLDQLVTDAEQVTAAV